MQMNHFSQQDNEWNNRAELDCLLDIYTISSRADLKSEISKEIERHIKSLAVFAQNPKVDGEKLKQSINTLNQLNVQLLSTSGKIDQKVSEIDLLKCLTQRSSIPGGTCDFDLPSYHFWLNKPLHDRRQQIQYWADRLIPIQQAITILLDYIRSSGRAVLKTATSGVYQQSLSDQQTVQLIRVSLNKDSPFFSEISGGKHRFTVRFMTLRETERPAQTTEDIDFLLNICQL